MPHGIRYRPDPSTWLPRVLTRAAAAEHGVSRDAIDRSLAAGRWERLAPGVYCTSPPARDDDLLRAAAAHGGPSGRITGNAALTVYGFRAAQTLVDVLVLVPITHGPGHYGRIRVRPTPHLPPCHPVRGLPLVPVARAVIDHGLTLRWLDDARAVVTEAVQRQRCSVADLVAALEHCPRRQSGLVRQAVAEVAGGARSAPEARAAATFRGAHLPEWHPNAAVTIGGREFELDFLFDELRADVEVDGKEYYCWGDDWERTIDRDVIVQGGGFAVLHIKPQQVSDAGTLLDIVVPWLRIRAADLRIPWRWA